jgi:hypothetical protein
MASSSRHSSCCVYVGHHKFLQGFFVCLGQSSFIMIYLLAERLNWTCITFITSMGLFPPAIRSAQWFRSLACLHSLPLSGHTLRCTPSSSRMGAGDSLQSIANLLLLKLSTSSGQTAAVMLPGLSHASNRLDAGLHGWALWPWCLVSRPVLAGEKEVGFASLDARLSVDAFSPHLRPLAVSQVSSILYS